MNTVYKTNRLVLCMTDIRNHIELVNGSLINGNLKKTMVVATVTNNYSTYIYIKNKYQIPVIYLKWDKSKFSREEYDHSLVKTINQFNPKIVLATGWKHIFTPKFIQAFPNLINIHPALPNHIIGLNCIQKALNKYKSGELKETGVMIHKIIEDLDRGEVLNYVKVPIYDADDLTTLTKRFRNYEQIPLLRVLQKFEDTLH